MSGRGEVWSEEETAAFLQILNKEDIKGQLSTTRKKRPQSLFVFKCDLNNSPYGFPQWAYSTKYHRNVERQVS